MYRPASNDSRKLFALLIASALPALFACGGDTAKETANTPPPCPIPADSILGGALERFISTRNPPPHRFLIPLGTDSVIPDGSQYVLNALGRASYIWPSDPTKVAEQVASMRAKGGFVTIGLFYHGDSTLADGRKAFQFSGLYIDRANDGVRIPRTTIYFNCTAPEGSRYTTSEEAAAGGQQPPPAGGAPAGSGGAGIPD